MWNLFVLVSRHSDELGLFENIGPVKHRIKVTIKADFRGVYTRGNPTKLAEVVAKLVATCHHLNAA